MEYKWMRGQIQTQNKTKPQSGDTIVLFFAPHNNPEPGIYGWGTILDYDEDTKNILFEPKPPSDHMKLNPIWDINVKKWVKEIRKNFNSATMWEITSDLLKPNKIPQVIPQRLREKILDFKRK
jgi:hypothetical protein